LSEPLFVGTLVADALARIVAATDNVAERFAVVDGLDETAVSFYLHYGFTRIPGTLRLVQRVSDIAAGLA
jgi:hypothetical protein